MATDSEEPREAPKTHSLATGASTRASPGARVTLWDHEPDPQGPRLDDAAHGPGGWRTPSSLREGASTWVRVSEGVSAVV